MCGRTFISWNASQRTKQSSAALLNLLASQYKPDPRASVLSAQLCNLSQTKNINVVQHAVEPLACASGLYLASQCIEQFIQLVLDTFLVRQRLRHHIEQCFAVFVFEPMGRDFYGHG